MLSVSSDFFLNSGVTVTEVCGITNAPYPPSAQVPPLILTFFPLASVTVILLSTYPSFGEDENTTFSLIFAVSGMVRVPFSSVFVVIFNGFDASTALTVSSIPSAFA